MERNHVGRRSSEAVCPESRRPKVLNAGYEAKCNRCQRLPGGAARINADLEAGARVICEPCPVRAGGKSTSRNERTAWLVRSSCVRMGSGQEGRIVPTDVRIRSRGRRAKAVSAQASRGELIHQRCKAIDMPLGPIDGGAAGR